MGILPQILPLLKPLTILIGPAPLFYLYQSWRSSPAVKQARRPLPKRSLCAIFILLLSSLIYASIVLLGGSENIFYLTKARFVTAPSILQTRLAKFRPLTQNDHNLIERLGTSLSERLNYALYGPVPIIHCTWCLTTHIQPSGSTTVGDATMYLLFSLPQIISPYLLHAFILGVTTTPFLTMSPVSRSLRTYIAYAIGLILAAELWILVTFDGNINASAHELHDVTWLHWDLHVFRYTSLAILSLLHAVAVYIIETGCIIVPPSMEDRLLRVGAVSENVGVLIKLSRTVREVVMRNSVWRIRTDGWWSQQRVVEGQAPEEIRRQWEGEARGWVDGVIKIEES